MIVPDQAAVDARHAVAELQRRLDERVAQQAAMNEVLRVINGSPGDLAPVFDAMLEKAVALCGAKFGVLFLYDGREAFRLAADRNLPPAFARAVRDQSFSIESNTGARRIVETKAPLHVADMLSGPDYAAREPLRTMAVELGGVRSMVALPLLKKDELIGIFSIYRREPGGFAENQITLVTAFAEQAVIAIENARLITETREALEQQTATAEVLQVINASPGDLAPVFDAMLEKAMRLCEAFIGSLWIFDGGLVRLVANRGMPAKVLALLREPTRTHEETGTGRILRGESVVINLDLKAEPAYLAGDKTRRAVVDIGGARSAIQVALRKDSTLLGSIAIYRNQVRPFSDKQIALLQNFAAQAVIAIENARLITETREALEQQTATAEVLQVINGSPGNLVPVFDAMLEKAMRLCEASIGSLWTRDGEFFRLVANRGMPASVAELLREPVRPHPQTGIGRIFRGEPLVINLDMAAEPAYRAGDLVRRAMVDIGRTRSAVQVALRKDGTVLGAIAIYRNEVRPFSDKQIALLQNFAAQAVIAMENARLLGELRTRTDDLEKSLEYQTATSDVLQVISRSTFDLQPVLDTLVEAAARLCNGDGAGIALREGHVFRYVAVHANYGIGEYSTFLRKRAFKPGRDTTIGRVALEGDVVHIADIASDPEYALPESSSVGKIRTNLGVPLLRNGVVVGMLTVFRQRVEPFTERQIELVRTFADQAVIAIENTRLITETREALEQQTATAEVLQVINSSPGDLAPVFSAILEKAHNLCGVAHGSLQLYDGEKFRAVATHGLSDEFAARLRLGYSPSPSMPVRQLLDGKRFVQVQDLGEIDDPVARAAAELSGIRTTLFVALRKDERLLGQIVAARKEVRSFSEKEIALLESFAAQAVIAMENARLLGELRERTADLSRSVDELTATSDVLKIISRSAVHLKTVLDKLVETAARLCRADQAYMFRRRDDTYHMVASHGISEQAKDFVATHPLALDRGSTPARAILERRVVHIPDVLKDSEYTYREGQEIAGFRTTLGVPLLRGEALVGVFGLTRTRVDPFTDKEIELVRTFADQALIAIENARLFDELRARTGDLEESLKYQTATSDVLKVISRSTVELQSVLDTLVETATRLCDAHGAGLSIREGEVYRYAAIYALDTEFYSYLRQRTFAPGRDSIVGRTALEGRVVHVADIAADPEYAVPEAVAQFRTVLGVPLLRDGVVIGTLGLTRKHVEPFTERQIELVQTFADQAVVAIENARLFDELRARTGDLEESLRYQTATSDVLKVISRSTFDLQPVLGTVGETAARLCAAEMAFVSRRDGDVFRFVMAVGSSPETTVDANNFQRAVLDTRPFVVGRDSITGRVLLEGRALQIYDLASDPDYKLTEAVTVAKIRTLLGVPLLREGEPIGVLTLARQRVEPFTERQIELVRTFADQAVIAIENTRLITETREALEQQTATSDVLKVISRSTFDLKPIFETIVKTAAKLCNSDMALIATRENDGHRVVELFAASSEYDAFMRNRLLPVDRGSLTGRTALEARVVHIADLTADPDYTLTETVTLGNLRTVLGVPLMREGSVIGSISLARERVHPFTERQIELVRTFADQAAIAIENARLITETREALEQQTATADVLKVISRSTFDLKPIFDTIVRTAAKLCNSDMALIATRENDGYRVVELFAASPEYDAFMRNRLLPADRGSMTGRTALEARILHVPDLAADPEYTLSETVTLGKLRTSLGVPLMREGSVIGSISLARERVQPFTERQIELVRTFADQAAIAIENARLIAETREALEQQTATAEILQVINSSPGNLTPVFDAILKQAHRLCDVTYGALVTYDGEHLHAVTTHGYSEPLASLLRQPFRPGPNSPHARLVGERRVVHIPDIASEPLWERDDPKRTSALEQGIRTMLQVPLCKDETLLGYFSASRREVRPFSDKEIGLLESFAAQAVIAMDNARLLNEIRQRQAELRVTFDNMGDGVAMFDAELRLAAWNKNFQQILDLPDALLDRRPSYADYIHLLAERGEFGTDDVDGELSRRLEKTDQEIRLERTRPDGRVIEVRRNSVPGGGFVLIYSDVTERKRAEEQVRAARDTAENALQELKTAQTSLVHAEKMASLGQLTAGIAHEIKNPLNFVNNFAGLSGELLEEFKESAEPALAALDEKKRAEIDETIGMLESNLQKIAEHGRRADGIVKSMLLHSRGGSGERQSVDLNALLEEALNLAYHGARAQDQNFNITLEREFDVALAPIELVPQDMTRVFLNLFGNGFYAANKRHRQAGGRAVLKVATHDLGGSIEVRVRDNGTGIAPENRDKLFQPFFTTKPTGEGTGLGLSISYDIVTQQHGGSIEVESEADAFTEFVVRLPRHRRATAQGRIA